MLTLDFESRVKAIVKAIDPGRLPIVIELAGMPRVGKTEFTDALVDLFRCSECKAVASIQDINCPITDKWKTDFSVWTIVTFIKQFYEFMNAGQEIIIADRGLFDAIVWLRVKRELGLCSPEIYSQLREFAKNPLWWKHQGVVLVFYAPIEDVLSRAEERRLYEGESPVTNREKLPMLIKALFEEGELCNQEESSRQQEGISLVKTVDSKAGIREVLRESTEIVLSSLEAKFR